MLKPRNVVEKLFNSHFHKEEKEKYLTAASKSNRRRTHKILHEQGAYDNEVFNIMMSNSYMTPHMHPGDEKVEYIYLIEGLLDMLLFSEDGSIISRQSLNPKGKICSFVVPSFTWHGYVVTSDYAITFETMQGVYSEETWKTLAPWAPKESSADAQEYLLALKNNFTKTANNCHGT